VADAKEPACIYVLAGTNGAGKSSIGGAMFLEAGVPYFDPDVAAGKILAANPGITQEAANAAAWQQGRRLLERALDERRSYALETTLGGRTIARLLARALSEGLEVRIWYVGLEGPELHIARVRSRVARGGHDIPEDAIRGRYDNSRMNLIRLLPRLTELRVYDNSKEADPRDGLAPEPVLLLHCASGSVLKACEPRATPAWAKPIVAAALKGRRPTSRKSDR
jgi:predicted ABC-type ATPase